MSISKNNMQTGMTPVENERIAMAKVEHLLLWRDYDIRAGADRWAAGVAISKTSSLKLSLRDVMSPFADGF